MSKRTRWAVGLGGMLFIVACATAESVTDVPSPGEGGEDASVGGSGAASGSSGSGAQAGSSAGGSAGAGGTGGHAGAAGGAAGASGSAGKGGASGSAGKGGASGSAGKGGASGSAGKGGSAGSATGGSSGTGGIAGSSGTAGAAGTGLNCNTSTGLGQGCDDCMKQYCMAECVTCESNPDCIAIRDCIKVCESCLPASDCQFRAECDPFYLDCGYSTSACTIDCESLHPAGQTAWEALTSTSNGCLANNCTASSQCGAACSIVERSMSDAAPWSKLLVAGLVGLGVWRARRKGLRHRSTT